MSGHGPQTGRTGAGPHLLTITQPGTAGNPFRCPPAMLFSHYTDPAA